MRFYSLSLSNSLGIPLQVNTSGTFVTGGTGPTFSSLLPNGQYNPGALNVEFDIPVVAQHTPQGNALIRVWGIGLQMIGQGYSANLNGGTWSLSAGMSKGLPLANPAQQGVIAHGIIYQAFGNWQGVNQTLDLICAPGNPIAQFGIQWSWVRGQPLRSALTAALSPAFPLPVVLDVNVSAALYPKSDQKGWYSTLNLFAQYLQKYTQPLGQATIGSASVYPGALISFDGTTLHVYDGTPSALGKTVALAFQDLIGQPTWIGTNQLQFKTVMRGDIDLGDTVTFPTNLVPPYALTSQAAAFPNTPARSKTVFQGAFQINNEIHHFANFRQADGDSWASLFVGTVPSTPAATT